MATRRALLIGIDAYPHVTPLNGCVNDVTPDARRADRALRVPRRPHHAADQRAGDARRRSSPRSTPSSPPPVQDDVVVFHFAGHGSQMADREGDEPSGFDSTIVPFDAARPGGAVPDITDDEINLRLEALAQKTALTTLIFDACHSGTITRDAFGEQARDRSKPTTRRCRRCRRRRSRPSDGSRTRAAGPSGWMPLDRQLRAHRRLPRRRALVRVPPARRRRQGRSRRADLLPVPAAPAPVRATSYRDVFERTAALVNALNGAQHPQMEGPDRSRSVRRRRRRAGDLRAHPRARGRGGAARSWRGARHDGGVDLSRLSAGRARS